MSGVDVSVAHACATPSQPRKGACDGDLWACTCGKVYVRRHWWNYAGDGWDWKLTTLRTAGGED